MKPALTLAALVTLSTAVFAQTAPGPARFAAADISVRARTGTTNQPTMTGGVLRGGRYDLRNATMLDLIATAYSVSDRDLVVGGPSWIERNRFDIAAKAPQETSPGDVRVMLQSLLADRFGLAITRESRPTAGHVLTVVAKDKHRLKEAAGPGAGCQGNPPPQPPPPVPMVNGTCRGVSMDQFAQLLRQVGNGYVTGPVQNQTGLAGYWDFDVQFTSFQLLQRAGADAVTLPSMLERLGLKLEQGQAPAAVFVVNGVSATPTPNPSGVSAAIPLPPPMEFDVAVIKLSPPDTQPRTRLLPGGRIEGDGITMQQIMQLAWDITTDELVANTPAWFRETKYSILAQTSTAVSGVGQDTQVDIDDLKAMLRQLVTERFRMKAHYEDRPVTAYTLVANAPKMAKADPANRTGFREGPAPGQRDQRNQILTRMVTVRNMSMSQFAEDLQRIAGGYIRVPVDDQTGLEGAYDFTLTFSPVGLINARGAGPGGAGGGDAADPTGGVSVFDAVERQLGLKLEMRKRPMKVLVIDSIQEKPID